MVEIDPRTGRPIGDHGTALQAIDWVLNRGGSDARCEMDAFLTSWMEGSLDEWPEFYKWLALQDKLEDSPFEIQVFGMHGDHLAERGETIEYYDILVRKDGPGGQIDTVMEIENITLEVVNLILPSIEANFYTDAEHLGG